MGRKAIAIAILLVISVIGFAGYVIQCEKLAAESLEISLEDVAVTRVGVTSCDIALRLRFYNPTDHDAPPLSAEYDVYIGDEWVGHGTLSEIRVPAHASMQTDTTITLEYSEVSQAVVQALVWGVFAGEGVDVTIKGVVHARVLFGLIPISVPFETTYSIY